MTAPNCHCTSGTASLVPASCTCFTVRGESWKFLGLLGDTGRDGHSRGAGDKPEQGPERGSIGTKD